MTSDIRHYIKGVRYPAGKAHLQRVARQHEAPGEVFDKLHDLPDNETYRAESDVLAALGVEGYVGHKKRQQAA